MSGSGRPSEHFEIRLGGTGGQGLILAGVILAEAATQEGFNVVQTQAYGPESRGGASRAEVIISRREIHYPEVRRPNLFLAMSQEACSKYTGDLTDESTLLIDTYYVHNVPPTPALVRGIAFTSIARDELGKEIVANIVALGALQQIAGLVSFPALAEAVARRVPKAFRDLNMSALEAGRVAALALEGSSAAG